VYVQIKQAALDKASSSILKQKKAASQVPATGQEREQEQHGKAQIIQEHALNLKAPSLLGPRFLCCGKIKQKKLCGKQWNRKMTLGQR
jgi:hypothetical protein